MDLRSSPRLDGVHVEFTTNCNLKCTYCAVSQPDYVGRDLDPSTIDRLLSELVALRISNVGISGHGETTSLPDWHVHAQRLIEAGSHVALISNLAKTYSTDELATLARCYRVVISIDTIDIELFKRLRRGGDLRRVLYNIGAVRAEAVRLKVSPPIIQWASVVCDLNVFKLPALVRYGLALGIRDFSFQNLVKTPDVKGSIEFNPVAALPAEDLARVPAVFDEIEALIASHGGTCDIQAGLREAAAIATGAARIVAIPRGTGSVLRAEKCGEGMTRDCLDPWQSAHIRADGAVKPCCYMVESVGRIGMGTGLKDIFEGSTLREYRDSLLAGNLIGSCVDCPSRGWIPVDNLKKKIQEYIAWCETVESTSPATEVSAQNPEKKGPRVSTGLPQWRLNAEIEQLRASIEEIQRSTSWRVTAPMRAIKRVLAAAGKPRDARGAGTPAGSAYGGRSATRLDGGAEGSDPHREL
jgi:MoaA/NifB/PqqE/SkfB family radical SAM enzyme